MLNLKRIVQRLMRRLIWLMEKLIPLLLILSWMVADLFSFAFISLPYFGLSFSYSSFVFISHAGICFGIHWPVAIPDRSYRQEESIFCVLHIFSPTLSWFSWGYLDDIRFLYKVLNLLNKFVLTFVPFTLEGWCFLSIFFHFTF